MALSYLVYYLAGFLWGLFIRDFWIFNTFLAYFQVFYFLGFGLSSGSLVSLSEFLFWLPLCGIFGCIVSITLCNTFNLPLLLGKRAVYMELYVIKIVIEFIVLHVFLCLWELLPHTPFPWCGIALLVVYSVAIFVSYWLLYNDEIWYEFISEENWIKGNIVLLFHGTWALFFLVPIIIVTLVLWLGSGVWMFIPIACSFLASVIILIAYCLIEQQSIWQNSRKNVIDMPISQTGTIVCSNNDYK